MKSTTHNPQGTLGAPLALCLVIAAALASGCATTPAPEAAAVPTSEQRRLALESFEEVWTTIRDNHWRPDMGGIDWQAVHDEFRPRVETVATRPELRLLLLEMIERLEASHYDIIPAEVYENVAPGAPDSTATGTTGLQLRVLDGQAVVFRVEKDSPAARAGVLPGWLVRSIDGEALEPALAEMAASQQGRTIDRSMLYYNAQSRLSGTVDETVEMVFLDGDGRTRALTIDRQRHSGPVSQMGNMIPLRVRFESRVLPGNIGYFTFNLFADPQRLIKGFNDAMGEFAACDGVIIDLRGNLGGTGVLATTMAGCFIDEKGLFLGTMIMRNGELRYAVNRRSRPFDGPVAILIDELSASTAEVLAGGMRDLGRARVFGTLSAGAALPSYFEPLANEDVLQYAVATFTTPTGREIEGLGIRPDEETPLTRRALLDGDDPALDAALAWLASGTTSGPTNDKE